MTETGEFLLWWERCNYYDMSEEKCRTFIRTAVRHEARHFDQWQRIAVNVLTILGQAVRTNKLLSKLDELDKYAGARKAFMNVWADPAHYQCREVEVYTQQIETGEMSKERLGELDFRRRLQGLHTYLQGDANSPGCANSKWALEFANWIDRGRALFKLHNFAPAAPGK